MNKLLLALLFVLVIFTPLRADDPPPGDDEYVVCGQEVGCDVPVALKVWLPLISQ